MLALVGAHDALAVAAALVCTMFLAATATGQALRRSRERDSREPDA